MPPKPTVASLLSGSETETEAELKSSTPVCASQTKDKGKGKATTLSPPVNGQRTTRASTSKQVIDLASDSSGLDEPLIYYDIPGHKKRRRPKEQGKSVNKVVHSSSSLDAGEQQYVNAGRV